ncbi:MAG: hypothetical protein IJV65_06620 [Kiritimatiellae bacterium]|nr:hypothetical protein [Kiritimatiellia bacterium]
MSASERFSRAWHIGTRTHRKRGEVVTTYQVLDDNGSVVAELPEDFHSHREQSANADLICDAVNRIGGLRDLVRRLVDNAERYHLVGTRDRALIREARAAIGEDAT